MTRKITGAVSIGSKTYLAGQEDELAKVMQAEKVDHAPLVDAGALAGHWGASEDEGELPTLDELEAHIAGMSAKEVKALQKQDERKGAVPIYEARLAALKGE